ncbi:2-dehydro-3-deoxygalactonokinase [Lewinella sp. IMCC34191]|uniref:2-dehydro-3-deoxygalactonokinase n=1 Tax=Lewinella sp. IMCC34191 TaxID=2259172 RepID=UPI001300A70E|nr:2-dehydro-3-deoxygalactonokinase [Lewinella sp. IMCC34191]
MANRPEKFISCDWGTTNFRLRVVDGDTLAVITELRSGTGIRQLDADFRESGKGSRFDYFADYLSKQLDQLPGEYQYLPVVASGMASSSIGMKELPYARLPFGAAGTSLLSKWCEMENRRLLLVSGVLGNGDIMRGEEVQAMGLAREMEQDGVLILPGTHAKHLTYRESYFTDFTTHMTGELFDVLVKNSILSGSVAAGSFNELERAAFLEGVDTGKTGKLSSSLFRVRVGQVIGKRPPSENYYYLSGLLIGEELRHLSRADGTIYLAASGPTHELYRLALDRLMDGGLVKIFSEQVVDRALHFAHQTLLHQHG